MTILLDPYKILSTKVAVYQPGSSSVNTGTSNTAIYEQAYSPTVAYTGSSHKYVYSLKPTATTPLAWSNNTSITSIGGADASLPPFPLLTNQSTAFFFLLNLITYIPDEVLQAGNASVHGFFTNISSYLTNKTKAVEQAVSLVIAPIESIANNISQDIDSFFKNRREISKRLEERSQLGDIVNQLSTLDACLNTSLDNNSILKVGDCASELAKLVFPLARIARVQELVGDAGEQRML